MCSALKFQPGGMENCCLDKGRQIGAENKLRNLSVLTEFFYQLRVGICWYAGEAIRKSKNLITCIFKLSEDLNYKSGIAIQNQEPATNMEHAMKYPKTILK